MLAAFNDRQWLWLSAGFYFAGFLLGTWSLLRRGRPSGVWVYALIAAGYGLQLAGLGLRGRAVGGRVQLQESGLSHEVSNGD